MPSIDGPEGQGMGPVCRGSSFFIALENLEFELHDSSFLEQDCTRRIALKIYYFQAYLHLRASILRYSTFSFHFKEA
jgi:hypothetical protein